MHFESFRKDSVKDSKNWLIIRGGESDHQIGKKVKRVDGHMPEQHKSD
jgi:hypothetical protein